MSFRTQDDAALLIEFLSWFTRQPDRDKLTDSEVVLRFIEQRHSASPAGEKTSQMKP